MKRKSENLISFFIGTSIVLMLVFSCENDNTNLQANCESGAIFNPNVDYGSLTDQEGNVYKTIQIGSQTWMAENLRTTTYRNGDKIPEVTENNAWNNLTTGAFCNYNNTQITDSICTFGRLYNYAAVDDARKIAPVGWHVPAYDEWLILEAYLIDSVAADKLKEASSIHWDFHPMSNGNNETGFTALPGGYRWIQHDGRSEFFHKGTEGGWWTLTEDDINPDAAFHVTMGYSYSFLGGCFCSKLDGYSVRCVKD